MSAENTVIRSLKVPFRFVYDHTLQSQKDRSAHHSAEDTSVFDQTADSFLNTLFSYLSRQKREPIPAFPEEQLSDIFSSLEKSLHSELRTVKDAMEKKNRDPFDESTIIKLRDLALVHAALNFEPSGKEREPRWTHVTWFVNRPSSNAISVMVALTAIYSVCHEGFDRSNMGEPFPRVGTAEPLDYIQKETWWPIVDDNVWKLVNDVFQMDPSPQKTREEREQLLTRCFQKNLVLSTDEFQSFASLKPLLYPSEGDKPRITKSVEYLRTVEPKLEFLRVTLDRLGVLKRPEATTTNDTVADGDIADDWVDLGVEQ